MRHTLEQLSAMPDRELDAVVARVVIGYGDRVKMKPGYQVAVIDDAFPVAVRPYSTDIAAAWEVVEKIRPRAAQIDIWARRDGTYACYIHAVDEEFWKEGDFTDDEFAEAKDAPRAASIAAVLAVEASRD